MNLSERIKSLLHLGEILQDLDDESIKLIIEKASIENPWFTETNIRLALSAIRDQFLTQDALLFLVNKYHIDDQIAPKIIGLVLAGNIPLVGFHDVLCCYLTGHYSQIKLSDKDSILMQYVIDTIQSSHKDATTYFTVVDKLKDYDAAIATGSNTTAQHFAYYFRDIPHIIRKNRNSVAVIDGSESEAELALLGADIFYYFGLGCRNVSKIWIPKGYDITRLFVAFDAYKDIIHHNKYKNNYDYNVALNLLNKESFLQNELLILKEASPIISRIGSVHYEYYEDLVSLNAWIEDHQEEIQCIVSRIPMNGVETVSFGQSQTPTIDTYADGVDTIQFLLSL